MTQSDAVLSTPTTGKRHVTLKLYASLMQYLPEAVRKSHAMKLEVDAWPRLACRRRWSSWWC